MTTQAVGSTPPIPTSTKVAPIGTAQGSTAAFEQQLHAARQRGAEVAPEREPAPRTHPQRSPDSGRGRHADPSLGGPHARQPAADTDRPDKDPQHASDKNEVAPGPAATAQATAKVPAPSAPGAAMPLAEAMAAAASREATPEQQDVDADGSEQGAAALVGAMLALIGPAVNSVLSAATAEPPAASGKSVATEAGTAALPQVGDAAATAATASFASTVMPAQLLAANGLVPDTKSAHDSAILDAAPALGLSALAPAALTAPVSVPIAAPAGGQAFAQELGQQVTWFIDQGVRQARIRLHPEELGSLDLKISVTHGRVDVVFQAQHPGAVTAVQQSLPQLGQMLAQHGLSLGNTEVGQHDRGEQSAHGGRGDGVSEADEIHAASLVTPVSQLGLLDAFA